MENILTLSNNIDFILIVLTFACENLKQLSKHCRSIFQDMHLSKNRFIKHLNTLLTTTYFLKVT